FFFVPRFFERTIEIYQIEVKVLVSLHDRIEVSLGRGLHPAPHCHLVKETVFALFADFQFQVALEVEAASNSLVLVKLSFALGRDTPQASGNYAPFAGDDISDTAEHKRTVLED